ncbi:alpha/beta hydrolase [Nocardia alni]|uniref:alpha/beta hydrolase n=1 Tax=Nocardia alni TaxID=2815723 RepID=UPI001C2250FD|nr:alpha/beta hydrolase [Nocardia alni]
MSENNSILGRPAPDPDHTARYGTDPEHVADIWLPDPAAEPRPLIVLLHGGYWRPAYDRAHTRIMSAALREAGWPVVAAEYRRVPGEPNLTTADIRTALDVLPGQVARLLDTTDPPIVLLGHSAGGQLALWASVRCPPPRLRATIALAPVADLRTAETAGLGDHAVAAFLGGRADARPDLDPVRLGTPAVPVTVVHGEQDRTVPVAIGRIYAAAHPRTRLVVVPEAGHFDVIDPLTPAWSWVLAELDRAGMR